MSIPDEPLLLTAAEAAAIVRRTEGGLAYWRRENIGPPWFRINGKRVVYPAAELYAWLDKQRQAS